MDKKMWPFFALLLNFLITSVFCAAIVMFSIQYKIPVRYWLLGTMWITEFILYALIWVNAEREINRKFYQDSTKPKNKHMTKEELIDKNKFIVHLPSGEELWFIKPEKCAEIMQQYAEVYQMEKALESLNQTGQTYMLPRPEYKKDKEIALAKAVNIHAGGTSTDDEIIDTAKCFYEWLIAE